MKSTGTRSSLTKKTEQKNQAAPDQQDQIRRRAQELYEQRGREEGHALEDWLQAEAEVVNGKAWRASASS